MVVYVCHDDFVGLILEDGKTCTGGGGGWEGGRVEDVSLSGSLLKGGATP